MAENQENTEFIHWQDLAEQLGADTGKEIDDYFGGTKSLGNVDLDDSDLPDTLPEEPAQATIVAVQEPEIAVAETMSAPESAETNEDDAELSLAEPNELDLEIGWNASSPTPKKEKTAKKVEKKPRNADKRSKRKESKSAKAPEPAAAPKAESADMAGGNHWDDLASTLGLASDAPEPVIEPIATVVEAELVDDIPVARIVQETPEKPVVAERAAVPSEPVVQSGFGAGLLDLGDIEKSDEQVNQENILGEMFVAPEEPFSEPADVAEVADDEPFVEHTTEGDDEFVEFEVEDLAPAGGGGRTRKRKRPSKSRTRDESSEQESEPKQRRPRRRKRRDEEEVQREEEAPARSDSRESRDEEQKRPKKKRRPKRDEESKDSEERPRRRKRRRSEEQSSQQPAPAARHADDAEEERPRKKSRRGKKREESESNSTDRKLPTWNDTINVVVEGNIESRGSKPQRKKRGGGRSRRGGNNRDKDRD